MKSRLKESIEKILAEYGGERQALLPALHLVQEREGHISEEVISYLASRLSLPTVDVYGMVTFYTLFSLKKEGKNIIRVCVSLPCYLREGNQILETLKEELGIKEYETTFDKRFTLEPVSCLGLCDQAPAMMINDKIYGNLTKRKVKEIIRGFK